jgi:Laminin G domain
VIAGARSSERECGCAGLPVWRIFVVAVVVVATLVVGVGTASADVIFSDGFESGDFSAWSLVKTGGGGSAVVQSSIVKTGSYAARLSEGSASGSKAYARTTFAAQQDLTASGDFQVTQQGASGGNVPFFRFLTSGGTRIISLYRQNVNGKIQVNYGGANVATSATLALNTWANLQLHVVIAGATSTVEVLKDGTLIYRTTSANLGTAGVSTVQIGNDTAAQAFTVVADTINVQNGGSLSPPSNTALPAIAGEAAQGQVLSASTGSWSGTQPITPAYQWQRCDTSGTNCAPVTGATGTTYTLGPADVGSTIVVAVTASNSAGSATASSAPTVVVVASPPTNSSPPTISGTPQQGQTLTANFGVWKGATPITPAYQWQRCDTSGANCAPVGPATPASTYTLGPADVGSTIVVAVTATNSVGSATAVSAATAVVQASSNTLFSDGFESGNFSAWSPPKTGGDGSAIVQSTTVKTGSYAAQLSETSNSGSLAYVRKTLASPQVDLTASGDFQVLQEGASGGNVPFLRFFTSGGTRIITLYRQNVTGKVQVGYGGGNFASSSTLALNTWANLQLHVTIAGAASTVQVLLNGTLVYSTTSANLGTTAAASLQLGNETAAQKFTLVADNITAQTSNTGPPVNTAPPAILGSAQQGQTLTATPGSWSGAQPIGYAWQWQRCDTSGANCAPVGTADSYTLTSADVGSTIVVAVTASNSAGSATASSAATMVVWTSSVVALWHMDEASGTTMFDSAGQNNGMLTPSVAVGQPGFSGSAYGFDGSSSYVSVPSADSMNPGSGNFSFTIALQTTGTPPPSPEDWDLIRKGDITTAGGEYKMEFQSTGQASCGFKGTHYAELVAGPQLNDGQWHTITCVKTSSDIELIVDGQTFATAATVGSISNTAPVVIGSHPGADWYQGSLDEATISIGS